MLLKVISVLLAHCLLCLTAVQSEWSVRHSSKWVCGLKGASVVLPCRYDYPWGWGSRSHTYQRGEWYKKQSGTFTEHSNSKYPDCSLKIKHLSDEHSGVYHFQFYTSRHRSWIKDTSGVVLSIADLQVREDVVKGNQNQTRVTCSSSCSLGSQRQYIWYKNGQRLPDKTTASILLDPTSLSEVTSYSCAVRGNEANRAPAVCAPEKLCWAVKCVSTSVCTLAGTSQDISCTYRYPSDHSIHTTSWEKTREPQVDLQLAEEFHDLSPYKGKTGNVTLKVSNLKEGDAGRYVLKIKTTQGKVYSGSPGITLFVTFLQVKMTPDTLIEGEIVTLTCNTICSLSNNPTFIWYKNGQPLTTNHTTRDNKLQLNPVSSEDSGNYSCAVRGHESLSSTAVFLNARYKPKNVSVSISASGDMGEGDTVTLTCSSDANPPVHNYTWYMKTGAESLVRGTGESISFNVTSDTSGLYYCQAQNEVGSQTSTEVAVQGDDVAVTLPAIITTFLILAVLLILGIVYFREKIRRMISGARATHVNIQSDSGLLYATVATRRMTSDPTHRVATRDQDDVQYANVQIKRPKTQTTLQEDSVTYASVQFHRGSAVTRAENDSVIYSGVNQL